MNKAPLLLFFSLLAVALAGCASPMTDEMRLQRLLRDREANSKTVEQHGNVRVESESKSESVGTTTTQSASVGASRTFTLGSPE